MKILIPDPTKSRRLILEPMENTLIPIPRALIPDPRLWSLIPPFFRPLIPDPIYLVTTLIIDRVRTDEIITDACGWDLTSSLKRKRIELNDCWKVAIIVTSTLTTNSSKMKKCPMRIRLWWTSQTCVCQHQVAAFINTLTAVLICN